MRRQRPKKKAQATRATKAQIAARVEELLRIRLAGARFWDVREYVREKEKEPGTVWTLPDGAKPISDPTLWRYIARGDELNAEDSLSSRKKLLRRHLAQRQDLYAKAVNQGDIRAALAVLDSEAKLRGLFPKPEDDLLREMARLKKRVEAMTDGDGDGGVESGAGEAAAADRSPSRGAPPGPDAG